MNWNKRQRLWASALAGVLLVGVSLVAVQSQKNAGKASATLVELEGESFFDAAFAYDAPTVKYGFVLDHYRVTEGTVKANQFLADILMPHGVDYLTIDKLVKQAIDTFDVRKIRVGQPYTILAPRDGTQPAEYFIYEPSAFRYVVYDLRNETEVSVKYHEVDTIQRVASGVIYSSLWNTMIDNGLDYELAARMEDALGYSVDFHYIQKEDNFKLFYEELQIDGEPVGIGKLGGAYFEHMGKPYYAIYFENDKYRGYFDEQGRPMKKAFLKSPVRYSRISSPFNMRRFHPVLKRVKPHLGTDYAAPHGTPIYAVANGVVTRSGYTGGNGNFVKIKHDAVYETQYLHMSKIAPTAKVGMRVKQGDVIGYVGSTGLATGPHVCFRFWKNGQQVDHRKENLPPPEPMSKEYLPLFMEVSKAVKTKLDNIELEAPAEEPESEQTVTK